MIVKRIIICLLVYQTLTPLVNAEGLQSGTEVMQKKSTKELWTETEVQELVAELNALSESYIKEAWSAGWNSGYSQGYDNGKSFSAANPPFKVKMRYCIFGFCAGCCTVSAASLLWQLRL